VFWIEKDTVRRQYIICDHNICINNKVEKKRSHIICFRAKLHAIDKDAVDVNRLVEAAKFGNWKIVWSIIGTHDNVKKAYLINAIPENRRWGVLQQAVYWRNQDVLKELLQFDACDSYTRVKKCKSECGATDRMIAGEIAKAYKYNELAPILSEHANRINQQSIPTLQPYEKYCDDTSMPLLTLTLASYKKAFHPTPIDPNKSITSVLFDIYNDLCTDNDRWKKVQEVVADSVFAVCEIMSKEISFCEDRETFFGRVVHVYTIEENSIYTHLNMAFRRQRATDYRPTGDDLAMGPYCVMYQILLLFWTELEAESQTTYRKMKLRKEDLDLYKVGTCFVWQSIVSSALRQEGAKAFPTKGSSGGIDVMYTIDNSAISKWRPRNIEKESEFDKEKERTYPAGARFRVTGRRTGLKNEVYVELQLLPN